jgi:hypothetical protein
MPQPQRNPDGTIQVAPPTVSAFAPQATQAAPPMQAPTQAATPEAQGAIHALIAALASAFAPRSIVQAKARTDNAVEDASGGKSATLADELSQ